MRDSAVVPLLALLAFTGCVPSLPAETKRDAAPQPSCSMCVAGDWQAVTLPSASTPADLPTCADPYSMVAATGWESVNLDATAPTCPACACGSPTGYDCQGLVVWHTNPCATALGGCNQQPNGLSTTGCTFIMNTTTMCHAATIKSFTATLTADAGTCAPSAQGTPTIPTLTGKAAEVCQSPASASSTGCTAGNVCVQAPAKGTSLCFRNAKAADCTTAPTGYQRPHVLQTAHDTRSCSACGCGRYFPTCTSSTASFYALGDGSVEAAACEATPVASVAVQTGACTDLPDSGYLKPTSNVFSSLHATPDGGPPPDASCTIIPSVPEGGVTLSGHDLYCCAE